MTVSRRISKGLFYLLLLPAVMAFSGWQGWLWWSWVTAPALSEESLADAAVDDMTVLMHIPEGTSAQQIGQDLEAAGLIRSRLSWNLWTRWQSLRDRQGGFLAGTYELSPAEPLGAIANQIWQGEVVQQSFTIPEGWSVQQMADYFEEQGYFSKAEFIAATEQVPRDRYPWLPNNLSKLEGFLYPDTYQADNLTPDLVVDLMLQRFERVALPVYQTGNSTYSLLEWVTLASIVEKEAVIGSERPQIASVFAKRLKEGIPLGADPTVEYGLGIRQTPEQPLTLSQVRTPSPYNTYINAGLPPGPISSPGIASLEASLNPADTEYLYFVARYDGTHVFSRTLQEHEAAQEAIRQGIEAQPSPSPIGENPN